MHNALYYTLLVRCNTLPLIRVLLLDGRLVESYSIRHKGAIVRRLSELSLTGRRDPAGAIRSALADLD